MKIDFKVTGLDNALDLLRSLQKERGMALVLITHNMGVVSEMAQRVAVMYAGQLMEQRRAHDLFASPMHPYTEALLAAVPAPDPARRGHRRVANPIRHKDAHPHR